MVKDHSDSKREETRCRHLGYSFRLAARVLLYASSHRQDNTYHGLCYTSRGAQSRTRNSSMGPPWRIDPTTMSERSYHRATSHSESFIWCLDANDFYTQATKKKIPNQFIHLYTRTRAHTHTYVSIYIYIYICTRTHQTMFPIMTTNTKQLHILLLLISCHFFDV